MTFEKRYITPDDYEEVCQWWHSWDWPPFPQAFLAPTGLMVSKEGVNLCAVWLYKTDAAICWAENYISNKNALSEDRRLALDFLMGAIDEEVKVMGFSVIMSSVKHANLCRRLERNGFIRSDENMVHYIKVL